jgi:hypothetical protein
VNRFLTRWLKIVLRRDTSLTFFYFQNFVQLERWIFFGVSLFSLERSSVRQSRE